MGTFARNRLRRAHTLKTNKRYPLVHFAVKTTM